MQAALGVAVDEALQLGMDWIWARIQELASLLRSLLAGASLWSRARAWLLAALQALHHIDLQAPHPLACPSQLRRASAASDLCCSSSFVLASTHG